MNVPNLYKISVGIRHRRSFRVPEIAGSIIDSIIRDDASPFFKIYTRTDAILDERRENKGRILRDDNNLNSLSIDIDSVILNIATEDLEQTIKKVNDVFLPYVLKNVYKKFDIDNINRIGVVFEYNIVGNPNFLIQKLTGNIIENVQIFESQFSSKEKDLKSLVMKDLLDYKNYIIAIAVDEENFLSKFDYQFYFLPEIKSVFDIDFEGFFKESTEKLEEKFLKWIKNEKSE
jgi:hypothetical protein